MFDDVLTLPKMSGYVKRCNYKDRQNNNKLMPFHKDDDKLFEKYKTIWTKIRDLSK